MHVLAVNKFTDISYSLYIEDNTYRHKLKKLNVLLIFTCTCTCTYMYCTSTWTQCMYILNVHVNVHVLYGSTAKESPKLLTVQNHYPLFLQKDAISKGAIFTSIQYTYMYTANWR